MKFSTENISGIRQKAYLRAWIDYNGDKDFYDQGELVFDEFSATGGTKGVITLPNSMQTSEEILVRIAAQPYLAPEACGEFIWGEVEDYKIRIFDPKKVSSTVESAIESEVILFPNPASNELWIEFQHSTPERIEVYDFSGKVLTKVNLEEEIGSNSIKINTEKFPSGTYNLKLFFHESEPIVKRFFVAK